MSEDLAQLMLRELAKLHMEIGKLGSDFALVRAEVADLRTEVADLRSTVGANGVSSERLRNDVMARIDRLQDAVTELAGES